MTDEEKIILQEIDERKFRRDDPCDSCDGTGLLEHQKPCVHCLGQGVLLTGKEYALILKLAASDDEILSAEVIE
jgi:DnaJ-class molecular chaperone